MARTQRTLNPQALFDYAVAFCAASEKADRGSCYPEFREAARHFRVNLAAIQQACEDWQGEGYMAAGVGLRNGSGHYHYERKGDYRVEAYHE